MKWSEVNPGPPAVELKICNYIHAINLLPCNSATLPSLVKGQSVQTRDFQTAGRDNAMRESQLCTR
jgi:hypothetical protein